MKNGLISGNFFRFVNSLFYWFRASTANKTRLCCQQLQLKQVNNCCSFVVPLSVYYVYAVSFARIFFFVQVFSIYWEAVAHKDDRDIPMSVVVSLTVLNQEMFWRFVIDSLLDILAPLLPVTLF